MAAKQYLGNHKDTEMIRKRNLAGALCLALMTAPVQGAISGSLTTSNGDFSGSGSWLDSFMITWEITQEGNVWHYKYTLTNESGGALSKDISHVILGTSVTFTENDISDVTPDFKLEIKIHSSGNGNPGMPGELYGIKFDEIEQDTLTLEFYSTRQPMWNDFYAKDGKEDMGKTEVYIYNKDFGVAVLDPNDYNNPAVGVDGTPLAKILAPDTVSTVIPAPGAAVLCFLGLGLIGWVKRSVA